MENKNNIQIVKMNDGKFRLQYSGECGRTALTGFSFYSYKSAELWLENYVTAISNRGGNTGKVAVTA